MPASWNFALRASLMLGVSLPAVPAMAQQATQDSTTPPPETAIIVTAQKSGAQSILNVPGSISALDSKTLEDAGVQDISDVAKLTPGMQFVETFGRAAPYLSIRGVASSITGTPTVQVFADGFTTGLGATVDTSLLELDRVEVAKGPQATLYGANAIGGVINYITKKPGPDTEADARFSYGELNEVFGSANLSGPLTGNLFGGIAGALHSRDGYLDNIATGQKKANYQSDASVRGALRAKIDATTIDLSATYTNTDDGCGDCSYIPRDFALPAALGATALRNGQVNLNSYDLIMDQRGQNNLFRRTDTEVLTIEHDFDNAVLTSITGRGAVGSKFDFDLSRAATREPFLSLPVLADSGGTSKSEELRLTNGPKSLLRYVLGVYYLDIHTHSSTYLSGNLISKQKSSTKNYAAFANVEVPIGNFTIAGGVRYDYQKAEQDNALFGLAGALTSKELLPKVTAEYHFGSDTMLYATASKGYKSGGVNVGSPDPKVPRTFNPEYLWNYEAGLKGRLFDNRLSYAVDGFRMEWSNRQVQLLDTSGLFAYIANLGKAHINGAEIELDLRPARGLSINANATYLDAKVDRYIDLSGVSAFYGINPDLKGNALPSAPKFSFSISPEYVSRLSEDWRMRARADISHTSGFYFDAQNLLRQNAYTTVNLYLGVEKRHFEVGVFAKNAFNVLYHTSGNLTTLGPLMTTSTPRIIGVRAGFHY